MHESFIDLMWSSDVFEGDMKTISSELIIALLGEENMRNSTTIALCHLVKNKESRNKVRSEIDKCMAKYNLRSVF